MRWNDKCTVSDDEFVSDEWSCDCNACSPRGVEMRREDVITDLTVMLSDMIKSTKSAVSGKSFDEESDAVFCLQRKEDMKALLAAIQYLQHEATKHSMHMSFELDNARKVIKMRDEAIDKLTAKKN